MSATVVITINGERYVLPCIRISLSQTFVEEAIEDVNLTSQLRVAAF